MIKILFFGDVIGKPGRRALAEVLPNIRVEHQPDIVIANVENLAHGKGVTLQTLAEMDALGFDVYTSGNHVFDKGAQSEECFKKYPNLIRPENYDGDYPGTGSYRFEKNGQWYTVLNLNGNVFFEKQFRDTIRNPFFELDKLLVDRAQKNDIILVDLHAEASSEKIALGWYADGRVSAVFGTHTHVPTADARILPGGTAVVTDVGMNGPQNSVIGVKVQNSLDRFLERGKFVMDPEEEGPIWVNALLVEIEGLKAIKVEKISLTV